MTTTPDPHHDTLDWFVRGHITAPVPRGAAYALPGQPVGVDVTAGEPVMFDPLAWFQTGAESAHSAPDDTGFVFGLNGFGKSTGLIRALAEAAGIDTSASKPADLDTDTADNDRGQL